MGKRLGYKEWVSQSCILVPLSIKGHETRDRGTPNEKKSEDYEVDVNLICGKREVAKFLKTVDAFVSATSSGDFGAMKTLLQREPPVAISPRSVRLDVDIDIDQEGREEHLKKFAMKLSGRLVPSAFGRGWRQSVTKNIELIGEPLKKFEDFVNED